VGEGGKALFAVHLDQVRQQRDQRGRVWRFEFEATDQHPHVGRTIRIAMSRFTIQHLNSQESRILRTAGRVDAEYREVARCRDKDEIAFENIDRRLSLHHQAG
jgi:hypothetical protein